MTAPVLKPVDTNDADNATDSAIRSTLGAHAQAASVKRKPAAALGACVALLAMIALSVAWEWWLAPLRPGGTALVLKAVPLLLALPGVWRRKLYTLQWASMLILLYFAEGVVRGWSDHGLSARLGWLQAALAVVFFVCALAYVAPFKRAAKRAAKHASQASATSAAVNAAQQAAASGVTPGTSHAATLATTQATEQTNAKVIAPVTDQAMAKVTTQAADQATATATSQTPTQPTAHPTSAGTLLATNAASDSASHETPREATHIATNASNQPSSSSSP